MLERDVFSIRRQARWIAVAVLAAGLAFGAPESRATTDDVGHVAGASAPAPVPGAGSAIDGTDFNGDGVSDVLWYAPGPASDYLWAGTPSGFRSQATPVGGTYTPVVGDFDGNGADDVLWYAPGGAGDHLWSGSASGFSSRPVTVGGVYEPVVGDFDGNGADDVLWYAPGGAGDHLWSGSASGFSSRPLTVGGTYTPVVGDFDGNGADDVLWYAPGGAGDHLWSGSASGFSSRPLTVNATYTPVTGDFDGNGTTDLLWYAPGAGSDYLWRWSGGGFGSTAIGVGGAYEPTVGDFDGNGSDDIVWYAAGAASDFLWSGSSAGFRSTGLSIGGVYQPIVGDMDGDGRTDIVWYAAGAAADYLWHSGTGTTFAQRSMTVNGHFIPLRRGVAELPTAEPGTSAFAVSAGVVTLRLPMRDTLYVGFHQASSPYSVDQVPGSIPVRWGVMPTRYRGTGNRTAADLVVPAGRPVLAPASGVVIEARPYRLYGRYDDELVAIAPTAYSGEVQVLHLTGVRVQVGDHVVGGVTEIAGGARRFSFKSQVDDHSGFPHAPHVHVEVSSRRGYRPPAVYG